MRLCILIGVMLALGLFVPPAQAILLVDGAGDDSGWQAAIAGAVDAINVVDVVPGVSATITIDKDFDGLLPPGNQFPVGIITISPSGSAGVTPVSRFIIQSESVDNNTGLPWTSFHWAILNSGVAHFNQAQSSSWTASPYTTLTWRSSTGAVTDLLDATGGTVADGVTFAPSGGLVIDVSSPVLFTFKEQVVPEPTAMLLVLLGLPVLARRRRK